MTEQLMALWQGAFGDSPAFVRMFMETAYAPERCQYFTENGRVTAALYWLDVWRGTEKMAYLYAVATHPDFRGRGLCRKLMDRTHAVLTGRGYAGALLCPAGAGLRRMYGAMGYRDCGGIETFSAQAGAPAALRRIGPEEYARLRRRLLPENGVIQEGENLRYLAAYADLYAGENFALAAVGEQEKLVGLELLGAREAAPGILGALGCPSGTFRVPGHTPFAMFRPLRPNAEAPSYFGLAFD